MTSPDPNHDGITNITEIISRVETTVKPIDSVTLFGISAYGLWVIAYTVSILFPDDDGEVEDDDAGDDGEDAWDRPKHRPRMVRCRSKSLKIELPVAIFLGMISYMTGVTHPEFDVIGWGHWLIMYFVNMLCFKHASRSANIGKRRTMGIIMYATIPFVTVLVAKMENQVIETRVFVLATSVLLLIPIKRVHTTWYREYDADSTSDGNTSRVLWMLILWLIQILAVCIDSKPSESRTYQLIADIILLFISTDGIWEHW